MSTSLSFPTRRPLRSPRAGFRATTADSSAGALAALSAPGAQLNMDRRRFLQGALLAGTAASIPTWAAMATEASALGSNERVLLVLMLGGGNDGLNMVIPARNGRYQDARGQLAIRPGAALSLDDQLFLHPNLARLHTRYLNGDVAIVQGVGEARDDHSHFSSMERWMSGRSYGPTVQDPTGWLGRWLDATGAGAFGGFNVNSGGVPLHLRGRRNPVVSLGAGGKLLGSSRDSHETLATDVLRGIRTQGSGLGQWGQAVAETFGTAMDAARTVEPIFTGAPNASGLVRDMQLAARLINLDVGARVIGCTQGGYDHHQDHLTLHGQNMAELDAGIQAFFDTLNPVYLDRVTIMTFSEFGRSFTANGSQGTDHGTASSSLVIGQQVVGGLYGAMPSFSKLDGKKDLHHTVDFRSVYASVIEDWLGGDSREILGAPYETLDLFQTWWN